MSTLCNPICDDTSLHTRGTASHHRIGQASQPGMGEASHHGIGQASPFGDHALNASTSLDGLNTI